MAQTPDAFSCILHTLPKDRHIVVSQSSNNANIPILPFLDLLFFFPFLTLIDSPHGHFHDGKGARTDRHSPE